jgi:hypothetical protein
MISKFRVMGKYFIATGKYIRQSFTLCVCHLYTTDTFTEGSPSKTSDASRESSLAIVLHSNAS